jgi:RNA polymerase-interacting CarD/CdnL/TRCF family regulator
MRGLSWLCVVLLVALGGCGGSSTLTEKSLSKQEDAVHSAAAEGELLASDVARDRTTEPFARVHSGDLAEQAETVVKTLREAEAEPGLEGERRQVLSQATRVERALEQLHSAPTNRDLARRLQAELERLAS